MLKVVNSCSLVGQVVLSIVDPANKPTSGYINESSVSAMTFSQTGICSKRRFSNYITGMFKVLVRVLNYRLYSTLEELPWDLD